MLLFITLGTFLAISLVLGLLGIIQVFRISDTLSNFEMTFDESGDFMPESFDAGPDKLAQATSVLGILLLVTLAFILVLYLTFKVTGKAPGVAGVENGATAGSGSPWKVTNTGIKCPECSAQNAVGSQFCTNCGKKIT